jgi:hypothetical protein
VQAVASVATAASAQTDFTTVAFSMMCPPGLRSVHADVAAH